MQNIVAVLRSCFKQWFPQRNLLIVSEHKVRHLPISGKTQCVLLLLLAGGTCWAAYSTGSYMAARMALKAQTQALKSIAGARVATNFNTLYPSVPLATTDGMDDTSLASLASPMFTLSALDNDKVFARMAFLEQKVAELQTANSSIIQHVREKTAGRINVLESAIRQAGLSPAPLKKELSEKNPEKVRRKSEGGPYIPDDLSKISMEEKTIYAKLDDLMLLQAVVDAIPFDAPVSEFEEQSGFGRRIDPFTGHLAFHAGLDMSGPVGTKVFSTADGIVAAAGKNGAYGNAVDIDHDFDLTTRYAHLSQVLVQPGQHVKKGDIIGIQGSTGRSTGPHVHYEVRYHNKPMNPKNFLKAGRHVLEN